MRKLLSAILIASGFYCPAFSQLVYHIPTQINGMPMQYLPSFAGNLGRVRISTDNYLPTQSEIIKNNSAISVDGFVPKLSSGIGLFMTFNEGKGKENSNTSLINYSSLGFVVAPKISIKGKYTLSPGLSLAGKYSYLYNRAYEDYRVLRDSGSAPIIIPANSKEKYEPFTSVSLLFNSRKYYLGTAFSFELAKFSYWNIPLQIGATFQRTDESKFSFSPNIVWNISSEKVHWTKLDHTTQRFFIPENINLNFRYQKALFGVGYGGFMVGFQNKNFRIMYTVNPRLTSHGLTIRLLFNNKDS